MTIRFSAFRQIRTPSRRVRKRKVITLSNSTILDPNNYDHSLFPVSIDATMRDEQIARIRVPSILHNKFKQQGIIRLGQLDGLDASTFLSWYGFGKTCLTALCVFLDSLRSGQLNMLPERVKKLTHTEFVPSVSANELSPNTLDFPIYNLNLSTRLKTHLKTSYYLRSRQVTLERVQDFISAFDSGKLSPHGIGFKSIQQIFNEIESLHKLGSRDYLEHVVLDNQSFLSIILLAKNKVDLRERLILECRFAPFNSSFLTLEVIAQQLGLTRERVRQLDKALIKKFQSGTLREFGWAIRRNALKLFQNPTAEFTFEKFIASNFFRDCTSGDSKLPVPILFLDRVFYATFSITKNTIQLTENARRNFT